MAATTIRTFAMSLDVTMETLRVPMTFVYNDDTTWTATAVGVSFTTAEGQSQKHALVGWLSAYWGVTL